MQYIAKNQTFFWLFCIKVKLKEAPVHSKGNIRTCYDLDIIFQVFYWNQPLCEGLPRIFVLKTGSVAAQGSPWWHGRLWSLLLWSPQKSSALITRQTRPSIVSVAISTSVPFILLYWDAEKAMLTQSNHKLSFMPLTKCETGESPRAMESPSQAESLRRGLSALRPSGWQREYCLSPPPAAAWTKFSNYWQTTTPSWQLLVPRAVPNPTALSGRGGLSTAALPAHRALRHRWLCVSCGAAQPARSDSIGSGCSQAGIWAQHQPLSVTHDLTETWVGIHHRELSQLGDSFICMHTHTDTHRTVLCHGFVCPAHPTLSPAISMAGLFPLRKCRT